MSRRTVIASFDRLLKPRGFARHGVTWNRSLQSFVDIIDVQISKAGDTFTINAGVVDREVYAKLWGSDPPPLIEQPMCTLGVRIGELRDGKDLWWSADDEKEAASAAQCVEAHVLPFLDRMHSRQALKKWLLDAGVIQKKYPLPIINLAIIKSLSGDLSQGCDLLQKVQSASAAGWRSRAAEVAERLGCGGQTAN